MANEALIVIGFGVALAVSTVSLFWAHVRRINAPNKVDPRGTLVEIADLSTALKHDRAAAARKRSGSSRSRSGKQCSTAAASSHLIRKSGRSGCDAGGADASNVEVAIGDGAGSGCLGLVKKCSLPPGSANAGEGESEGGGSYAENMEGVVEETCITSCTMVLPSPLWAEAIVKHADTKRKTLRGMVRAGGTNGGGVAVGWEGTWARLAPSRKRKLLEGVREELVHAVSAYIGQDEALFGILCPDLSVDALETEFRGVSGLSRLIRQCLDGKLPEPKSRAYVAVQAALARAAASAAENVPKNERGPVRAFLPTFRKLCSYSFCIGVLEAVVSGRADGSTGPTVSSVLGALVRTGGSGFLIWLFFHGLQQMSTDEYIPFEGRDAATVLPAASFTAAETSEGLVVAGAKGSAGGAFCHALEQSGLLVDVGGRECEARRA